MRIEDLKEGMRVRFHPIIGGKHDGRLYKVVGLARNVYGRDVAWLEGIADAVDVRALSKPMPGADNYDLPQGD